MRTFSVVFFKRKSCYYSQLRTKNRFSKYTISDKFIVIQSGSLIMNPYWTKNFVHNIETSY